MMAFRKGAPLGGRATCLMGMVAALALGEMGINAYDDEYEQEPIRYSATKPNDMIQRVEAAWAGRQKEIAQWTERRRLEWLMGELGIAPESQVLVFSRTSLQRRLISPTNPRALYFSDEAYLGWVPGGAMEVTVFDPNLGAIFYVFDAGELKPGRAMFDRSASCLDCHTRTTRGTPGFMARSVFPDERGEPILKAGTFDVDGRTPLEQRWGGWYVTGRHGSKPHMGNVLAKETPMGALLDTGRGSNLERLDEFFATERYPRGTSDLVALMVFEHQMQVQNELLTANQAVRVALHRWRSIQEALGEKPGGALSGSTLSLLNHHAARVVRSLLFWEEAPLPAEGVSGEEAFVRAYQAGKVSDSQGRSLKELDLKGRLYKYRCSPVIYSKLMAELPPPLRSEVLERLRVVLVSEDAPDGFGYLDRSERRAIHDILRETLPNLPDSWRGGE